MHLGGISAVSRRVGLDLTPLISATYPLEEAMAAVEKARTKGTLKVQIRVCSDEAAPELDTSTSS